MEDQVTTFDIRQGEQVRCTKDVKRHSVNLHKGAIGKVVTMRMADDDPEPQYLVKWVGKSGPIAVGRSDIERQT
jgi:hypothetical protein